MFNQGIEAGLIKELITAFSINDEIEICHELPLNKNLSIFSNK